VLGAAGNADDVARLRIEATTVYFVQIAALEDAKDLRLGMLMWGRPFPGALMVSMMENAPPLAEGDMWTMRSSPIAGIAMGASAPLE
jgi:hypothetical protein